MSGPESIRAPAPFPRSPPRDRNAIESRSSTLEPGDLPQPGRGRVLLVAGALLALFLAAISGEGFVDPDVFHQLALIREALALGRVPIEDRFAYTQTVLPSIHHEWGTGAGLTAVIGTASTPFGIALHVLPRAET